MVGLAVLIALAGFAFLPGNAGTKTHVTVELRSAVAVYPGDEVRVLGVPIGTIISITPQPSGAVAEIEFDSHVKVPANARAAVVSPSLVSTRYIQLVPAYRGGPQLQSGAVIPVTRTATPVEFDQLKASLSKLATDLGPLGTSRTGALGEALDVGAANLDGQGAALKTTIDQMGKAATTLSAGAPDLFSAVRNLNQFVGALNENDAQVRQFTDELSSFSNLLSDNRKQLGDMLRNLDSAVDKVQDFTNDNRGALHENVVALRKITTAVAQKRQSLADLIHIAPTAAEDFFHIYNPDTGALTGVLADSQLASPAQTICSAIYSAGGKPEQCISALSPFADLVRQYHLPILGADPSHSGPGALPAVTGMLFPGGN
jgi:phospholipid/cholesterol/gamma-HCH transport system substrate-binding protein